MRFGFKQPLVGEKRCVTTLITAAEETMYAVESRFFKPLREKKIGLKNPVVREIWG